MQSALELSRACFSCGSLWGKVDFYCGDCWMKFCLACEETDCAPVYDFPVRSIFAWHQGETQGIKSNLLLNLKGGELVLAMERMAWQFAKKNSDIFQNSDRVFVPAPPREAGKKDHAYVWGESLKKIFGGELHTVFARSDLKEQKSMKLGERKESRLKIVREPLPGSSFVFVDDLIASGSTANAAWKALGKPNNFEVWTLAHRPRVG